MKTKIKFSKLFIYLISFSRIASAQNTISLTDLSPFTTSSENWKIRGDLTGNNLEGGPINTKEGTGVLVCTHTSGKYGLEHNIFTKESHGDLDLELDFVMAHGSNSGIYLMSRYEVQLFDSWGVQNPTYSDCGGIYERWNESRSEGSKGYEGIAPRINVAKAPGLWQHLEISFQAPRFDALGKKIANAKFISVRLNGVSIHENVEVSGSTRAAVAENETDQAPLMIQGDHGHVAFKKIVWNKYSFDKVGLKDLKYGVYKGAFKSIDDIALKKPTSQGNEALLNWSVSNEENDFGIKYTGTLQIPHDGNYTFTTIHGGSSQMKIDGKNLFETGWLWNGAPGRTASIQLYKGDHSIEYYYWKTDGWLVPLLGLFVASDKIRKHPLHATSSAISNNPLPQIVEYADQEAKIVRSFMDIQTRNTSRRVVHAISVGHPSGIHYTYDQDKGSLIQFWRGNYLNTTPMWHDRGDGNSVPLGSVMHLTDTQNVIHSGTFRPKGYQLDENEYPAFIYSLGNTTITDKTIPKENGKYFERMIQSTGKEALNFYICMADKIDVVQDQFYNIDDGKYYIKVIEGKSFIESAHGHPSIQAINQDKIKIQYIW